MRFKRIVSTLMTALIVAVAYAGNNYKVISSSPLNIRESASSSANVLGTFNSGSLIEVLSIKKGWAKVKYNGKTGYVSDKYIAPLPKPAKPVKDKEEKVVIKDDNDEQVTPSMKFKDVTNLGNHEIKTPLVFGSSLSDALNLYFAVEGCVGWSDFLWNGDTKYTNGVTAYSGNIMAQLYFEDKVSFIPRNWYSEIVLGFNKLGAGHFEMSYLHLGLCPFGYRIPIGPLNIVAKVGIDVSLPLNDLKTSKNMWSADFQCGGIGGLQIEWKQFSIGGYFIYDFTEVSSSCNQILNNIGILGTLSYKFGKLGHSK